MIFEGDEYILSSGKRLYSNNGIIGLSPRFSVYHGYDGHLCSDDELTKAERAELADYMISMWSTYREKQ